ncbi:MAG: glycerophosphodiester phosphodiesterase [Acidimicrobiia bacterium]|jgi:glycerophosphoryl diester phosphodiesterase
MTLDPVRWHPPVPIAHRGSRALWPENTDVSFQGAYDLGFRHFETDLHLTADGVLVCFHDDTVDRTTDGTGPVDGLTLTELQQLDAGYRHRTAEGFSFRGAGVRVPTLEWLLTTFPDTSLVLDMKTDGLAGPLAALVDDLNAYERLIVGSFSDERLTEFREITDGRVPVSSGSALSRLWVLASRVGRGVAGDASALQLPTHMRGVRVIDEKLVDAAHDAGLQVHVWTVNERSEMSRLLEMGVDGLVTDRPDILKELLTERGEWR